MPDSGHRKSTAREDACLLAPLLGIENGRIASDWFPAAGRWSIGRDTTLTIRSVLASECDARSTAMALLSDEPFFRWLPDDDDDISCHFGKEGHTVQPWLAEMPNTQRQLDRHDPYACTSALDRPFPMNFTKEVLGVSPVDAGVRRWAIDAAPAFYAEAWGAEGGRGEHAWSETGSRIFVSKASLTSLLQESDRNLVTMIKLQKYHRGKSSGRGGDTSAFTHRSLIVILNKRGEVWMPKRLSQKTKLALNTLDADRRRDFYPRFRAIAGLPDEWLARRAEPPVNTEVFRLFIESLNKDDPEL